MIGKCSSLPAAPEYAVVEGVEHDEQQDGSQFPLPQHFPNFFVLEDEKRAPQVFGRRRRQPRLT